MKLKKTLFSAILALTCVAASAQEAKVVNVFNPHWYVQLQGGAQYTLGEVSFSDLLSPNAQVGVGYNFTPVLGARLKVNAWQSKAGIPGNFDGRQLTYDGKDREWKWNYAAPSVDLTINLSNLLCGYNPNRFLNVGIFGGVGANVAFKNDEAADVRGDVMEHGYQNLSYLWDGTKVRFQGQFGANVDFRLSDKVSLGIEASANTMNDHYNSKKAGNADWYFNGLVGLKINLGKTHTTREAKCCEPQIVYKDRVVEKVVEKPVEKIVESEPLRETIFYAIRISDPNADQIIDKVVAWCNKYPTKTITVDGYADKGTGTPKGNIVYAQKRAEKVAKKLQSKGVDASRMTVNSYGDTVQPYDLNDLNRCVIIVGK